jgi:hypothetical protein
LVVGHAPGKAGALVIVGLTIALAAISRQFIELRFTAPQPQPRRTLAVIGGAMAVVLAGAGVQLVVINFERQAAADRMAAIESAPCFGAKAFDPDSGCSLAPVTEVDSAFAATDYGDATIDDCGDGRRVASIGDAAECSFGDEASSTVVVLTGDSHAGHWLPALQVIGEERGWHIVTLLRSSCPFTTAPVTIDDVPQTGCAEWRQLAEDRIVELDPQLVVVSSLTPFGYEFAGGDLGDIDVVESGYVEALSALTRADIPVLAIHDTPYMEIDVPSCLGSLQPGGDSSSCDKDREAVLDSHVDPLWDAAGQLDGTSRVDLSDSLCTKNGCLSVAGGVVLYRDRQHLTATYARSLADPLLKSLSAAGVQVP